MTERNRRTCVREARNSEWGQLIDLLAEAGLPTADLSNDVNVRFYVAEDDHSLLGCVAIITYESNVLVRSLAVREGHRNEGIGTQLLDTVERAARDHGARDAYLLTLTAESFFCHRDYRLIDRSEAPSGIAASTEFASVCPVSAAFMKKRL